MRKRILLIDDEDLVVRSLSRLLGKGGYEVLVCRSGKEALNVVEQQDVDLIVCDVRMPEMSGIETIESIRKIYKKRERSSVPEILITGYADETLSKKAEELRVAEYIYKPFDLKAFLACVAKNLKP